MGGGGRVGDADVSGSRMDRSGTNFGANRGLGESSNILVATNPQQISLNGTQSTRINHGDFNSHAIPSRGGALPYYTELLFDMPNMDQTTENQAEKKRRRELGQSPSSPADTHMRQSNDDPNYQHFLSAGPGHQACREQ